MADNRKLSILYVAYPLLAVSDASAGGAEQMLLALEREISAAGHRTTVAAAAGSHPRGRLLPTGAPADQPDQHESRDREQTAVVLTYLQQHRAEFDLIHDQSGSFFRHAAACPIPVLASLHLPRSFYPKNSFRSMPRNLYLNCVSQSQAKSFHDLPNVVGAVSNGITAPERFPLTPVKDNYVLWLGRICEEKAPHLAIAAAARAALPLVIAGQVYPFRYHQQYFDREIAPHLSPRGPVRFIATPSFSEKRDLLARARALLLTSTVEETSSLVAMEAMACGTPVIAFRRGAFPEVVADGITGFVVESLEQVPSALAKLDRISPDACRSRVERHFSASRMARHYQETYRRVLMATNKSAA